jgi:hypothetical protein
MGTLTGFLVDAEVMGLWAKIETAVYDGLGGGKGGDQKEKQQNDDQSSAPQNGEWDGYHEAFVANSNR